MIDTSPLYDPINHRYKGVYRAPNPHQFDAIVTTPQGKLVRKGRFISQEEAAQTVATYYLSVYGPNWPEALKTRWGKYYRIRKMSRYPYMANLHKGPKVTVYIAEVMLPDRTRHRVIPADLLPDYIITDGWNEKLAGWTTTTAALVAVRIYAANNPTIVAALSQSPESYASL